MLSKASHDKPSCSQSGGGIVGAFGSTPVARRQVTTARIIPPGVESMRRVAMALRSCSSSLVLLNVFSTIDFDLRDFTQEPYSGSLGLVRLNIALVTIPFARAHSSALQSWSVTPFHVNHPFTPSKQYNNNPAWLRPPRVSTLRAPC